MKKTKVWLLTVGLAISLCACGEAVPSERGETTALDPTAATTVTPTPVPEETPTPTPELVIPDTLTYSGSGDDVVVLDATELEAFHNLFVFHITGNEAERHFAVKGYDEKGKSTELFVNTTDSYEGVTFDVSGETTTLEVSATGTWTINVESIFRMPTIATGETVSGVGDGILLVMDYGATAHITGNEDERHFAVKSYGDTTNLMVNTTDTYDGTVLLKGEPIILEVDAEGAWTITFD